MRRRENAFTLVELLVVIGIITVLISILLPVLNKAREQARTVVCASNERQIALAVLAYASDNMGLLPNAKALVPPNIPTRYEAIGVDNFGMLNWERGLLWPYISSGVGPRERIFNCPSDIEEPRYAGDGNGHADVRRPRNFSYSLTSELDEQRRLNQIHHHSQKLLVLELTFPLGPAGEPNLITDLGGGRGGALIGTLAPRHANQANEAFFDGHVELMDPNIFAGPPQRVTTPAYLHYFDLSSDY